MKYLGIVCIFSEDATLLYEQSKRLSDKNYLVFATSNIYKFVKYVKELQPDIMVFDMDARALIDRRVWAFLRKHSTLDHKPVLMVGKHLDRCYNGIAHYEVKPYAIKNFDDIVDSYCRGNKKHDVLLIDECNHSNKKIKDEISSQNLSCFEVQDTNAARYYLLKNNPRCICLNLPYEKCIKLEPYLQHEKIFFVENSSQVKNLARLI